MDDDCLRSCVAFLLGRRPEHVPHFHAATGDARDDDRVLLWWWALNGWLHSRGLYLEAHAPPCVADEAILVGTGPRGVRHAVVRHRGGWYDPHPAAEGLVQVDYALEIRGMDPVWHGAQVLGTLLPRFPDGFLDDRMEAAHDAG